MAQTFLNTGTQAGNFEDLANFITRISYEKTPFLSKIGRAKAKAIKHEWMTQALRSGTDNAQAEGFTPSFAAADVTVRVRRANQLQIIAQEFSVSKTQEEVDKAGLGQSSEYDHQKELKFKEIALDMDYELLRSSTVTRDADAGTAGEMDGAITVAGQTKSGSGGVLTQDLFNQLTQLTAEQGADLDMIFAAGFQRRMVSSWTTAFKSFELNRTTLQDTIETYKGDFGTQGVVFDKQMPTDTLLAVEMKYVKAAFLRPAFHQELGTTTDGRRGYVGSELTLEYLNPNAIGTVTNLATA